MSVTFELPHDLEQQLREKFGDLGQAAKEAFLVQSYRESRLSVGQIARILQRGVVETQAWLAERGASVDYSPQDLEEDRRTLRRLFHQTRR
ncbi:MAG TPA: UPF0175 family protein [Vicinamibacteria bacterium]|nr:UPF0175 family protein [Vicinamibacteria bacterium]